MAELAPLASRERGDLLRTSGATGVAAAVAVVSGLALDVVIAAAFGAGRTTDAFFVAARLPIGAVTILGLGANQALVPLFSTWVATRGERPAWRSVSSLVSGAVAGGVVLAGLAALLAAPLVTLLAPGLEEGAQALAAELLRILVLVVPLTAVAEILRALLNARHSFVLPALSNGILNAVAAAVIIGSGGRDVRVVAWAYVVGSVVRIAALLPAAYRRGFRPSLAAPFRDPDARAAARLCGRPMMGAGLAPAARIVEQMLASFLPAGSITILNYGYRLVWAIGGTMMFRSVVVAIVPRMSEATAARRDDQVRRLTATGTRIMMAIALPLTAFMAVLAAPAVRLVFRRGNFGTDDAALLGVVVALLSACLVGEALQRVLLTPFFARLDVRTPLRNAVYGVGTNLLLLGPFMLLARSADMALLGVAAAFVVSEYVGPVHAWRALRASTGTPGRALRDSFVRFGPPSLAAGVTMAVVAAAVDLSAPQPPGQLLLRLLGVAAAGVVVLAGAALPLGGIQTLRDLRRNLRPGAPAAAATAPVASPGTDPRAGGATAPSSAADAAPTSTLHAPEEYR